MDPVERRWHLYKFGKSMYEGCSPDFLRGFACGHPEGSDPEEWKKGFRTFCVFAEDDLTTVGRILCDK